jgi:hypothetical protein
MTLNRNLIVAALFGAVQALGLAEEMTILIGDED